MASHSHGPEAAPSPSSFNLTTPSSSASSLPNSTFPPPPFLNATLSSFISTCSPTHFLVPLFDGPTPDSANSFTAKNQEAHLFLGACLCLLVVTWSLFALEFVSVKRALMGSGCIQVLMGVYLTLWLFVFMHPHDLSGLFAYTTSDLLQLQHLSIALLLLSSGTLELCQSFLLLTHSQWSVLWTFLMAYVGLVFFAHEQHSYWATVQHLTLGFAMVCGAILQGKVKENLGKELEEEAKKRGARKAARRGGRGGRRGGYEGVGEDSGDDDDGEGGGEDEQHAAARIIDCNLILSGGFFSAAAGILIIFRDHSHGQHTGTSTHCQPAWPLTAGGYVMALVTLTVLGVTVCLQSRRCRVCADACCPVDEQRNVWLRVMNCMLCVKRRAGEGGGGEQGAAKTGTASAAMLRALRAKEEEEERDRERAVRRLQEMQRIFAELTPAGFTQRGKVDERGGEEEGEEEEEEERKERSPRHRSVVELVDDGDDDGEGRSSQHSHLSSSSDTSTL